MIALPRLATWGFFIALCLMAGAIGGALTRQFGTSSYSLSYADFVSVMLTAISLLMTLLAFFIAILAYIGWQSITSKVASEVKSFLDDGFQEGEPLHRLFIEQKDRAMFEGVLPVDKEFNADASVEEQGEGR